MQKVLDYLCQTGREPFKRKFAFGRPSSPSLQAPLAVSLEQEAGDDAYYDYVIDWLVQNTAYDASDASLWWAHVTDPEMPVSSQTLYAVNVTQRDIDDTELLNDLIEGTLPSTERLRQWFPNLFHDKAYWALFGVKPKQLKYALVLHFESTLHLWESFFDNIAPKTMWVCFLTVGVDVKWEALQSPEPFQNTLDNVTQKRLVERILHFIKPSDQVAAALQNAETLLVDNNDLRLYDICRAILPFPGAEYALQLLGVDISQVETTAVVCDNTPRPLRPCQSAFLARIWYLLEAEKSEQDWQTVFLDAIAVFDEPLLEHVETEIALEQFKAFIKDRQPPARWLKQRGRHTLFEITDRETFLRCLYWFQPEQLFVPWIDTRRLHVMSPIENEQWNYEKWRWNICVNRSIALRNQFYIPGFSPVDFNSSILRLARVKEKVAPINRYAPSDL